MWLMVLVGLRKQSLNNFVFPILAGAAGFNNNNSNSVLFSINIIPVAIMSIKRNTYKSNLCRFLLKKDIRIILFLESKYSSSKHGCRINYIVKFWKQFLQLVYFLSVLCVCKRRGKPAFLGWLI